MRKTWLQLLSASLALGASMVSCANEPTPIEEEGMPSALQGGQVEHGYEAVGMLQSVTSPTDICTGTLVAPQLVLTAAHCVRHSGYQFVLHDRRGRIRKIEVNPKTYEHPLYQPDEYDMRIVELSQPVTDIAPMPVRDCARLKKNDVCTAVGFGAHLEADGTTSDGQKRSGTEIVISADARSILVGKGSGLADHGDSGGPLICKGAVVAVVRRHYDASAMTHRAEYYTVLDVPWVKATIADPSSSDRDPRRVKFDCSDYPVACTEQEGQSGIQDCSPRDGPQFFPCPHGCENREQPEGPMPSCIEP